MGAATTTRKRYKSRPGPPRDWTDAELVSLVWDWRVENGACTLGDLVKSTGMSRSGLHARVHYLIREGLLTQSETVGSIRASSEVLMRRSVSGKLVDASIKRGRGGDRR